MSLPYAGGKLLAQLNRILWTSYQPMINTLKGRLISRLRNEELSTE